MQGVTAVMHIATAIRADEPKDQSLVIRPALEGTERVLRFAQAAALAGLGAFLIFFVVLASVWPSASILNASLLAIAFSLAVQFTVQFILRVAKQKCYFKKFEN